MFEVFYNIFYNFGGLNQEIFLFLNKVTNIGILPYFLEFISFCFNITNFAVIYILYCIYLYIQLKKIKNLNELQKNMFWEKYNKLIEIGIVYAIFGLTFTAFKFSVNLPRPFCSLPLGSFTTIINTETERCLSSFPSSHAGLALLVTYFACAYLNLPFKIIAICIIGLVSLARISLAMHYPADIVYGIIITFIVIVIGKRVFKAFENNIIKSIGNFITK
ncbi:phosphatase PAP2 family protein [Rickettsia endosymbiont of Halotydeus destructor]|uniref:phosphatase PAP2 family protein n=1 Tax=Rickettsia endosymbiont of Halotydeus destructor TaxID=2996754 RepID=UPI003BAEF9E8